MKRATLNNLLFLSAVLAVSIAYADLRLRLNSQYSGATWQQLHDLTAPIPFGHRVLVPLLARPIVDLGASLPDAFHVLEAASTFAMILALRAGLMSLMVRKWATVLSLAFPFTLPMAFLLRLEWPIFYPYDTPSMLFVALGLLFIFRKKWTALTLCVALGALNRESALLIPALFSAIYLGRMKLSTYSLLLATQLSTFFLVRFSVSTALSNNPQPYGGPFAWHKDEALRINDNLIWLLNPANDLRLLATIAFLPLICLALRAHLPDYLKRAAVAGGSYFLALLFIGNPYEPRIFGELILILFFVTSAGLYRFLNVAPLAVALPSYTSGTAQELVARLDRILVPVILAGFAVAIFVANRIL
ncbi:MAG: hypothetical protein ACT4PG_06030 [Panacagrimonas sp.]